ncbi:MAG: cytochrome c [Chloroflexota bacterium]|nr:cytochrome c [Chloroflexota bacterium]
MIKSVESRILTGIVMFVAIMILVGWVAINEEARMQAFVYQHTGRSIERGAELYASLCAECHGEQGYGALLRAPGLNNPHFFGYDPVGEQTAAIANANRTLVRLSDDSNDLFEELTNAANPPSDERQNQIQAEMEAIQAQIDDQRSIIAQAIAVRQAILGSLSAAVEKGLFPLWDTITDSDRTAFNEIEVFFNNNGARLAQVGWAGDLRGYVVTTLIHGRPGSLNIWPNSNGGMVAWSQLAGGALRQDQIEDLATYILNWDKGDNWTLEDFLAVEQYGKPLSDGSIPGVPQPDPAGDNPEMILARWAEEEIVGSAGNGAVLYDTKFGCTSCHRDGASAPDTIGTWTRVLNERLTQPQFAGYTGERYLIESIVLPAVYAVDSYSSGVMPADFGTRQMTDQQLADVVAFLKTQE